MADRIPMPDFWSMIVREKLSLPEEWRWKKLQTLGDHTYNIPRAQMYCMVSGAVYKTLLKSGKRKGQINFKKPEPGTEASIVVGFKELDDYIAKWEQKTGTCGDCYGNKTDCMGNECHHCNGTGQAPDTGNKQ